MGSLWSESVTGVLVDPWNGEGKTWDHVVHHVAGLRNINFVQLELRIRTLIGVLEELGVGPGKIRGRDGVVDQRRGGSAGRVR